MSPPTLQVDRAALIFFEEHIRKERRRWELASTPGRVQVIRHESAAGDVLHEVATLRQLTKFVSSVNFPAMEFRNSDSLMLEYIRGVRGDTAFDALYSQVHDSRSTEALEAASALFRKLRDDLTAVQTAPINPSLSPRKYAVRDKLRRDAVELIRIAPDARISLPHLLAEIDQLCADFNALCSRPFRDANPKNSVVRLPEATDLRRARGERAYLASVLIRMHRAHPSLFFTNTFQLDFSGWQTLVPEFDDAITLVTHRSTIWLPRSVTNANKLPWRDRDVLVTAFVRHFRLTVRKIFYQLLHISGYQKRYLHDPALFYARFLHHIARALHKRSRNRFSNLVALTEHMLGLSMFVPDVDYFLAHKH